MFDVDDVKDTVWDETPYEKLVLPGGEKEKELILAFSKHRTNNKGFDDFVRQKGISPFLLPPSPIKMKKLTNLHRQGNHHPPLRPSRRWENVDGRSHSGKVSHTSLHPQRKRSRHNPCEGRRRSNGRTRVLPDVERGPPPRRGRCVPRVPQRHLP